MATWCLVCKKAACPPLICVKPDDRKQVLLQLIPPLTQILQGQGQAISLTRGRFCPETFKVCILDSSANPCPGWAKGFSNSSSAKSKAFLESSNTHTHKCKPSMWDSSRTEESWKRTAIIFKIKITKRMQRATCHYSRRQHRNVWGWQMT